MPKQLKIETAVWRWMKSQKGQSLCSNSNRGSYKFVPRKNLKSDGDMQSPLSKVYNLAISVVITLNKWTPDWFYNAAFEGIRQEDSCCKSPYSGQSRFQTRNSFLHCFCFRRSCWQLTLFPIGTKQGKSYSSLLMCFAKKWIWYLFKSERSHYRYNGILLNEWSCWMNLKIVNIDYFYLFACCFKYATS